jgi:hypothetical protein
MPNAGTVGAQPFLSRRKAALKNFIKKPGKVARLFATQSGLGGQ